MNNSMTIRIKVDSVGHDTVASLLRIKPQRVLLMSTVGQSCLKLNDDLAHGPFTPRCSCVDHILQELGGE